MNSDGFYAPLSSIFRQALAGPGVFCPAIIAADRKVCRFGVVVYARESPHFLQGKKAGGLGLERKGAKSIIMKTDKSIKVRDTDNDKIKDRDRDPANRDPITGAPGAHPVGTGVGAAAGGATGAAIGAVGGPVGAAVGLVAGGVIGGLAGKAGGESVDSTGEGADWGGTHATQPVAKEWAYEDYGRADPAGY